MGSLKNRIFGAVLASLLILYSLPAGAACPDTCLYTGHDSIDPVSAVSIVELAPVKFGNFAVSGTLGGGDADIVMDKDGARVSHSSATDIITLLNGSTNSLPDDVSGAEGPGLYNVSGANSNSNVYITFVDHGGTAISSGNPVVLIGPVGSDTFNVDSFTFNKSGTDGGGDYITTNGSGDALVKVGATLHTKAGAATYTDGVYRGTFEIVVTY